MSRRVNASVDSDPVYPQIISIPSHDGHITTDDLSSKDNNSNESSDDSIDLPSFGSVTQKLDSTRSLFFIPSPAIPRTIKPVRPPSRRSRTLSSQISGLDEEDSVDGYEWKDSLFNIPPPAIPRTIKPARPPSRRSWILSPQISGLDEEDSVDCYEWKDLSKPLRPPSRRSRILSPQVSGLEEEDSTDGYEGKEERWSSRSSSRRSRILSPHMRVTGLEEEDSGYGCAEREARRAMTKTPGSITTAKTWGLSVSASERSLASTMETVPGAVEFANQCLERSYARRYTSSQSTVSSVESSSVVDMTPSLTCSSDVSIASSSVVSYKSKASFSAESKERYLLNIKSNLSPRVRDIRRELRLKEIKCCREKCVRSVGKSMVHYRKLDTISDSNHGSEELSVIGESPTPDLTSRITSMVKTISNAMSEAITINLIFFSLNIFFLFYRGSYGLQTTDTS